MQDSHVLCMFLHLHKTEKNQFLEAYLKYRVIIYTCQVETETKKRNKNETNLLNFNTPSGISTQVTLW